MPISSFWRISRTAAHRTRILGAAVLGVLAASLAAPSRAAPIAIINGPPIPAPDRVADFQSLTLQANINGHVEDGLRFSIDQSTPGTALAYIINNSWPCCGGYVAAQGFIGNVAYFQTDGTSPYKFARVATSDGAGLSAVQFQFASGYGNTIYSHWEMFNNGAFVGSGEFSIPGTGVVPLSLMTFTGAEFDELRIGTYFQSFTTFAFQGGNGNAAEIANVAATLATATAIPEPTALALFGTGLLGLGLFLRRTRRPIARAPFAVMALCLTFVLAPTSAGAAALVNWGTITYDPNTGLEWLDVSLTDGQSINAIQAGFGGYIAAGFHVATVAEVVTLFANAGLVALNPIIAASSLVSSSVAANYPSAVNFVSLVGFTDIFNLVLSGQSATITASQGWAFSDVTYTTVRDPFVSYTAGLNQEVGTECSCGTFTNSSAAFAQVGVWLVREATHTPEPATLAVLGTALVGLGLLRRRHILPI